MERDFGDSGFKLRSIKRPLFMNLCDDGLDNWSIYHFTGGFVLSAIISPFILFHTLNVVLASLILVIVGLAGFLWEFIFDYLFRDKGWKIGFKVFSTKFEFSLNDPRGMSLVDILLVLAGGVIAKLLVIVIAGLIILL